VIGDEARIRELQDGFRRDGLPNLIVDLSATEDIFTRAIPFLSIVFVLEIVNALDIEAGWKNLLLALGGAAVLFGAFGLLNVVRGRRFLSIPTRVGVPELTAFVVLPALLPALFSRQFLFAFDTILANLAIIGLAYIVVGFGLVPIVRWVAMRFFVQLRASVSVLVKAAVHGRRRCRARSSTGPHAGLPWRKVPGPGAADDAAIGEMNFDDA